MDQTTKTLAGTITDVFAHRFVLATPAGAVLADLGPKGAERVTLKVGDRVEVTGEPKPSELKVRSITLAGGQPVEISHEPKKDKHDKPEGDVDPAAARRAVEAEGFTVVGEPRRKPKHFEIDGRGPAGDTTEFHVAFDGTIRQRKAATSKAA